MAVLKADKRNKLATGSFALPSKRKYPIHDMAHAKAALSMAARGDTEGDPSTIRAKVLQKYPSLKKKPTKKQRLQKWQSKS
jgi:hypothetical protein